MRAHSRIACLCFAAAAIGSSNSAAVTLDSCVAIKRYFQAASLPADTYTVIQDLRSAAEFLGRQPSSCESYYVEWVRWTYADSLDRFSRGFRNDPAATTTWANQAVQQYQNYLEWFLALGRAEQIALIQAVTGRPNGPDFDNYRRQWLRRRVGGILNSLGALFEFMGAQQAMIDAYTQFTADCMDVGAHCMEIIPLEVVQRWAKWLRSMPDYVRLRSDEELKRLIKADDNTLRAWAGFKAFLDSYLPANPSARGPWEPLRRKVALWLS